MPLRHQRTKYKTQQAYKTSELMEQKNLAKPHQRHLILDIELACNKTEPSVCFHPAPLCVEFVKVTVTNCNKLDDDFIEM